MCSGFHPEPETGLARSGNARDSESYSPLTIFERSPLVFGLRMILHEQGNAAACLEFEMYKNPAKILIVFLQSMIKFFDLWLTQESQNTLLQLS